MTRGPGTDGDNPAARQDTVTDNPAARQDTDEGNPAARQDTEAGGPMRAGPGPGAGDGSAAAGGPGAGARRARLVTADELPGDPVCLLPRVCPACGSVAGHDPPVNCPGCGREITAT